MGRQEAARQIGTTVEDEFPLEPTWHIAGIANATPFVLLDIFDDSSGMQHAALVKQLRTGLVQVQPQIAVGRQNLLELGPGRVELPIFASKVFISGARFFFFSGTCTDVLRNSRPQVLDSLPVVVDPIAKVFGLHDQLTLDEAEDAQDLIRSQPDLANIVDEASCLNGPSKRNGV